MITDADLDSLRTPSGADAGSLYLEQMIADHEGAIEIAEEHIEEGRNPGRDRPLEEDRRNPGS